MPPYRFADPNSPVHLSARWIQLGQLAKANQSFSPLELKGAYVVGLVDDICRGVECLLRAERAWPELYLPAFGLFASSVDLLGRCLTGNSTLDTNENLRVGLWYLFNGSVRPPPKSVPSQVASQVVLTSQGVSYSIDDLRVLRDYCAHGQAARKALSGVDNALLENFPQRIGTAMETYWSALLSDTEYCLRLGKARLDPLSGRVGPLAKSLEYFADGLAVGDLFFKRNWSVAAG